MALYKHILAIRNDVDIKIDLFITKDGWYHIRWLRAEDDGVTVTQKTIGLTREEIAKISLAVAEVGRG